MKASYLLIGLVVLVAVAPQAGFAQCWWSYVNGDIYSINSGDVGMGVTNPGAKLHVKSDFEGGGPTIAVQNAEETGDVVIDFLDFEGSLRGDIGWLSAGESSRVAINQNGGGNTTINEDTGNVGIGLSSPARTLHVNGAMRLEPKPTPTVGALGDLCVGTDGHFYFHNGSGWLEVK